MKNWKIITIVGLAVVVACIVNIYLYSPWA